MNNERPRSNDGARFFYHSYKDVGFMVTDQKQTKEMLITLAEQGHHDAQLELAHAYRNGDKEREIEKDLNKARYYYQSAAPHNPYAAFYCARLYWEGAQQDHQKATEIFKDILPKLQILAENNEAEAQNCLALIYDNGWGVLADPQKALSYIKQAAKNGDGRAHYNLGVFYYFGEGVKKNIEKAKYHWQQAAQENISQAQYNLALLATAEKEKTSTSTQAEKH